MPLCHAASGLLKISADLRIVSTFIGKIILDRLQCDPRISYDLRLRIHLYGWIPRTWLPTRDSSASIDRLAAMNPCQPNNAELAERVRVTLSLCRCAILLEDKIISQQTTDNPPSTSALNH